MQGKAMDSPITSSSSSREVSEDLREIVSRVFNIEKSHVSDDLSREKMEEWDSLNHLLLISQIEEELGIEFTTQEVIHINTFKSLREVVSKKLRSDGKGPSKTSQIF